MILESEIEMEEIMLQLNGFSHNHHPFWVKMLAKYIRRGISVFANCLSALETKALVTNAKVSISRGSQ